MQIEERHARILELLIEQETVSVTDLSDLFEVSLVTIRNDLNHLEEMGRVVRLHGGARLADERTRQEVNFNTRQRINADQKFRIGQAAANLIQPGEAILLDASSTAVAVGQALKQRADLTGVIVVTTGIWTALEMLGASGVEVVLAGGSVRNTTGSITGSISEEVMSRFHFHRAFLGAWGLTPEEGLMDSPLVEVELKQSILSRCLELNAVVDGSKFGRKAIASFATVDAITRIITDDTAPADMVARFEQAGVTIIIAP